MSKPKKKKIPYNGRDYNILKVIGGATKAGTHKDHKKEQNKYASREKINVLKCIQCGFPIDDTKELEDFEEEGFCSITCFDYFTTGP